MKCSAWRVGNPNIDTPPFRFFITAWDGVLGKHTAKPKGLGNRAIAGLLCLILSALSGTIPFILMISNSSQSNRLTDSHAQAVGNTDVKRIAQEYADAQAYNQRLYEEGQPILGEAEDPWTGVNKSESDNTYRKQLSTPKDGVMATIKYPRLGINLPIRHGTSQNVLAAGAGHLYGSSLPRRWQEHAYCHIRAHGFGRPAHVRQAARLRQ